MKITKNASGKTEVRISKYEWEAIGNKKGWMKEAQWAIPANQQGNSPMSGIDTQPEQQQQQQQSFSGWTFNRLMQDPNFQQTFQTIQNQRANEEKILQYWKSLGIQYETIPEIVEVIG